MPRSNYTKIFDLLTELAKEDAPKELFELAQGIQDKEIDSFAIWRPGPEPGSSPTKTYCSTQSIRRLIRFARDLGFVEIGEGRMCSLTSYGQRALTGGNYPRLLATHLAMYLNENAGVSFTEIRDAISSIRRPEVPFFDTVFRRITDERDLKIGEARFRAVLYLLERSGMLSSMTRKIYFAPESQAW